MRGTHNVVSIFLDMLPKKAVFHRNPSEGSLTAITCINYFLIAVLLTITYKKLSRKRFHFSKRTASRMLSNSKHYIVSSLMVTIFAQTDRIMLKGMLNETALAVIRQQLPVPESVSLFSSH